MSAQLWDWVVAGFAVAFAIAWLAFYLRGVLRRKKTAAGAIGACGAPCPGCPFEQDCGGRPG